MKSFFIVFLIFLLFAVGCIFALETSQITTEVTVTDKVVNTKGGNSKYLIFTDKGVYENTDSLLFLKFDSSDMENGITIGDTYEITTYGWRIPFLSWYPNIISITED